MGLADSVKAVRKKPGVKCAITVVREKLPPKERAVLDKLLADPDVQHAELSRGLKKENHPVDAQAIGRHRRGDCTCGTR